MRWNVLAAIVVAFVLGLASAVNAEPVRIPKTGVPAFSFDAPAGWQIVYDKYGNLQFSKANYSVQMQLSIMSGPEVNQNQTLGNLAAGVLKSGGFPPSTRRQAGVIAGRTGQTFFTSKVQNGVRLLLDITLVRLDAEHVACLARMTRYDAARANQAALDVLVSSVRFIGVQ
jgi:hypothetical protein